MIFFGGCAYSALHDVDANKPSGSIKIRVKTYAHTLMLLSEKLEDEGLRKVELLLNIAIKKLALLEEARKRYIERDGVAPASLDAQIETLRASMPPEPTEEEIAAVQQAAYP